MKITGNETTDRIIVLAGVGVGIYFTFPYLRKLGTIIGRPTGEDEIPEIPGCPPVNMFRATVIGNQMDSIYSALTGANLFNYPKEVNVILGYTNCELKYADFYFVSTYGTNLKTLIEGEWDIDGDYDAAEAKLQSAGL